MKAVTDDQYRDIMFWLGYAMSRAADDDDKRAIISLVKELERQNNDSTL